MQDLQELKLKCFNAFYSKLYEQADEESTRALVAKKAQEFDEELARGGKFKEELALFVQVRGDLIMSDREAAAYMLTVEE